jgi:hypothetical protein
MRTSHLAISLAVAALVGPGAASAVVVVRHAVYVAPHPVVVVAPVPVYVAPPPTTVYVAPAPQAPPPPLTSALPVNTTMWVLPSGCMKVAFSGQTFFQCGPNWLKPIQSDKGPYYAVVPAPQ